MNAGPTKLAIYERGMWTHVNNLNDHAAMSGFRRRLDEDSQAEAPLYGLGPLTFVEEFISDPIVTMPPTFVAILRRYRGAIVDNDRAEFARSRRSRKQPDPKEISIDSKLLDSGETGPSSDS